MPLDYKFRGVAKLVFVNRLFLLAVSLIALSVLSPGAGFKINTTSFINPWTQLDGEAYLTIAERGYVTLADGRSLYNFLPLYPFLIGAAGMLINDFGLAAFLISNAFALIASYFLFQLAKHEFGMDAAKKTVALVLFFPTAFFFSAVYTESLFLALATASFYYARRGDWTKASILAWFLPFIRIVGLLMWIVLVTEYLSQNRIFLDNKIKLRLTRRELALSSTIIGVAVFFVYSYFTTGTLFGYANQQNLWSRTVSSPHVALVNAMELILFRGPLLAAYSLWNLFVLAFFVSTLYYAFRHMRKSYGVYMLLMMILPLLSSTLEGFSRFILICFPSFMIAAKVLKEKSHFYTVLMFSAFLLVVLTARFVTGSVGTLFG